MRVVKVIASLAIAGAIGYIVVVYATGWMFLLAYKMWM